MSTPTANAESPFAGRANVALYLAVALVAGAVIVLQIGLMRVFAVGSWSHFGSVVVSLAMLGFGVSSVVMCIANDWFVRHWRGVAGLSLFTFGPLMVASTLVAQTLPFNPVFLVSDPEQKWRLLANFLLYLTPFLAAAFFLGVVFLKAREAFPRVYFADLTGSGLAGLLVLGAMFVFAPEEIVTVPLLLWALGGVLWFVGTGSRLGPAALVGTAAAALAAYLVLPAATGTPAIAVSPYKGVAYARNFPDATRILRTVSPFGDLQVYASSYMHFAPGLSDNAAFNLPDLPANTYVGLYIDGDGPEGIMRALGADERDYFSYLPTFYPYVVKAAPRTFVVQFGGGISTNAALAAGAPHVTVAQSNPAVLAAFDETVLRDFTGDVLRDPRVSVVPYDGRLYLAHTAERFDVIDLSLADSVGLSNPGGFAIVERYAYTLEAIRSYLDALAPGGVLAITLWNKEEPPKSVLKLYATMAAAAQAFDPATARDSLFAASSYLSTTTVLYKRGSFTPDEIERLAVYSEEMSWDVVYAPGIAFDPAEAEGVLDEYRQSIFGTGEAAAEGGESEPFDPTTDSPAGGEEEITALPSTKLARLAWQSLMGNVGEDVLGNYVFDARPLTNDRPFFAAYVKPADLGKTLDRLELFQDEWGYLLLWATFAIACGLAALLVLLPMVFAWRTAFASNPGKAGTILYFACLGLGYIMVEVGLIGRFTLALANPTVSASVLIAGMLVFSGLGSLAAGRVIDRAARLMPVLFLAVAALLFAYGHLLDPVLDRIGALDYGWRLVVSFALIAPPAFLMGFPMAVGMTWLARLGKQGMFIWAWGINGCFSVVGAALVPLVATAFGLAAVLDVSAVAYLLAIPALFAVMRPRRGALAVPA
jgi:spermidine synthase